MIRGLRYGFFLLIVWPLVLIVLGLNVRHRHRLPVAGPAIIVANHNSHLDTLVLITLLGLRRLDRVRPVAAADYFLGNRLLAWFATRIIGIIPIRREKSGGNPLKGCFDALRSDSILILYPEGSRGDAERMSEDFKAGVRLLAMKFPDVPIHPMFLHGAGKALPKGEGLLVPFFCDVFVGTPVRYRECGTELMPTLIGAITALRDEEPLAEWH